jgi:glycosyltransferase involved in cell wall biosynthesis
VIHVIGSLVHGGAETVILKSSAGILKRDPSFEFRVCALLSIDDFARSFSAEGIAVDCLHASLRRPVSTLLKTIGYFRAFHPHIIHTHLAHGDRFGQPAALLCGIRARVCTLHNLKENRTVYERFTNRMTGATAHAIVAVSNSLRIEWITHRGMPEQKMHTIYNAASFEAPRHLAQTRSIAPAKSLRCVCIGNIRPVKGHTFAIEAMREIVEKYPACTLEIYGSDPDGFASALQKQITDNALEKAVHVKGPVDYALKALTDCDILLIPSLSEGFSIAAVEAMSVGVPVIASDIPVHREILNGNECGLLVEPRNAHAIAEAVLRLAADPQLHASVCAKAVTRATTFSQDRMAEKYLDLYKSLI